MSAPVTPLPPARPWFYQLPVIGRIAREISEDINNIFYLMIVVGTLEVLAFRAWGPVVLTMTALVLVPLMFLFFVMISWPGRSRD